MNIDMFRTRDETENLLLSILKTCETDFDQTHTKPKGNLS